MNQAKFKQMGASARGDVMASSGGSGLRIRL
jgi:hypothetical protein